MKRVLITGTTGFVGKNILPLLKKKYDVFFPSRKELDLLDENKISEYIRNNKIDVVLQCANPNPVKNPDKDNLTTMFEDSMRIFYNFYNLRGCYDKMIYIGSGAEYAKTRDIVKAKETDIGKFIPEDSYGLAKLYMNELARNSDNIYNLRLFGCYGPYDHSSKFITHAIDCCLKKEDITIRQNCVFDYIHVTDVAKAMIYMIDKEPEFHDYNVCSGKGIELFEIASIVKEYMSSDSKIKILKEGFNKEYTGSNERFLKETKGEIEFMDIITGIKLQIKHEEEVYEKKSC